MRSRILGTVSFLIVTCILSVNAQTTKTPAASYKPKQTETYNSARSEARRQELQELLDWPIVTMGDGSLVYFNKKTLQRLPGGVIHVWVKDDPIQSKKGLKSNLVRDRKKQGLSLEGFEKYSYSLTLYDFSCKQRKSRTISIIDYDDQGHALDSIKIDDISNWKDIAPGTVGDEILAAVCALEDK